MRHLACQLIELKLASSETDGMTFSGHGAVFKNVDAYGDVIEPGAFAAYLADAKAGRQAWPAMLSQHGGWGVTAEDMTPIGVWTELAEDGTGLKVTGKLADTPRGRDLHVLMKMMPRPAIDGLSIGYTPKEWEPRSKPEDPRRRLKRVDLVEISPVTFPANRLARVSNVKGLDELASFAEIEDYLREAGGFSRGEAKGLIRRIKALDPREAGDPLADVKAALSRNITILKG
jgi:HK97 family phage prohead protease